MRKSGHEVNPASSTQTLAEELAEPSRARGVISGERTDDSQEDDVNDVDGGGGDDGGGGESARK